MSPNRTFDSFRLAEVQFINDEGDDLMIWNSPSEEPSIDRSLQLMSALLNPTHFQKLRQKIRPVAPEQFQTAFITLANSVDPEARDALWDMAPTEEIKKLQLAGILDPILHSLANSEALYARQILREMIANGADELVSPESLVDLLLELSASPSPDARNAIWQAFSQGSQATNKTAVEILSTESLTTLIQSFISLNTRTAWFALELALETGTLEKLFQSGDLDRAIKAINRSNTPDANKALRLIDDFIEDMDRLERLSRPDSLARGFVEASRPGTIEPPGLDFDSHSGGVLPPTSLNYQPPGTGTSPPIGGLDFRGPG